PVKRGAHRCPDLIYDYSVALATRSRHQCRMRSDPQGPHLIRLTDPTTLQKRAMELWRAFPVDNTPNPA
ncbi:MAG: hypothetical protein OXH99_13530, partial [Bryobacterales bacterium]|nr:hypothetical protein [Bryobacterales bacterium]